MSWDGSTMGRRFQALKIFHRSDNFFGFRLSFRAERDMHGHLVAVKVGVETVANQQKLMAFPPIKIG